MFRKEFVVKTKTSLKKSDKRSLLDRILQTFKGLTPDEISSLVTVKDDVFLIKIRTHSGAVANVYSIKSSDGDVPMFFALEDGFFPTVYALWKCPTLVVSMETNSYVYKRLMNGADLMSPGVNRSSGSLTQFDIGQACAVRIRGNLAAVAVGTTAMTSESLKSQAEASGKAVIVNHTYLDYLWASGPKTNLPDIPSPHLEDDEEEDLDEEDAGDGDVKGHDGKIGLEGGKVNCDDDDAGCKDETTVELERNGRDNQECMEESTGDGGVVDREAMDELMLQCFLCALKRDGKHLELPIMTSDFYKNYMIAYCPESRRLDVKRSSFKKVTNFLKVMQEEKIIAFEDDSQRTCITSVDLSHEKITRFRIPDFLSKKRKVAGAADDTSTNVAFVPPEINIIYSATSQVLQLLKCDKKKPFTKSEVNQAIINYARENNLQNREKITMDPFLGSVVLGRNENVDELHIKDVTDRVLSKMTVGYEFVFQGQSEVRNGKPKMIEIDKKLKASNKMVTSVKNLKFFELNIDQLAAELKKELSCSVSVSKSDDVLSVQGDHQTAIRKHLKERYNMPERYIVVK